MTYLFICDESDKVSHSTIAQLFNEILKLLWPNRTIYEYALFFVTDFYMVKATKGLQVIFNKKAHITYLAHAFLRFTENFRMIYNNIVGIISNVNKIFFTKSQILEMKSLKNYFLV